VAVAVTARCASASRDGSARLRRLPAADAATAADPITEAKRPLTEAKRPLTEAKRPLTEAKRPVTEAKRPLTEAKRPAACGVAFERRCFMAL
jgi:hypothetical protein